MLLYPSRWDNKKRNLSSIYVHTFIIIATSTMNKPYPRSYYSIFYYTLLRTSIDLHVYDINVHITHSRATTTLHLCFLPAKRGKTRISLVTMGVFIFRTNAFYISGILTSIFHIKDIIILLMFIIMRWSIHISFIALMSLHFYSPSSTQIKLNPL